MIENKDQPAFPVIEQTKLGDKMMLDCTASGVTKLEFFACNAPNEIPSFFVHTPPEKKLSKPFTLDDITNEEDRKVVKDWQYDPIYDLPEHLQWYSDRLNLIYDERRAYELEDNAARYFQWRRYYAEQLLTELSKA